MHIKKDNDEVIEMEINYGRMGIIYSDITEGITEDGDLEDIYNCNTCGNECPTEGGIKPHLEQMHRGVIQSYDLICSYCVGSIRGISTLNRHIRNKNTHIRRR